MEELREDEREREPDDVGRNERAADEPASSAGEPASMLEDAQCQLADLGQRRTFEHGRQRVSCRAHPAGPWSRSRASRVLRNELGRQIAGRLFPAVTVPHLERAAGSAGVQDGGAPGAGVGRRGCGIQRVVGDDARGTNRVEEASQVALASRQGEDLREPAER